MSDWIMHITCPKMSQLPVKKLEMYNTFVHNGFSIQLSPTHPFGRIPVDQTIEEMAETQTPEGTMWLSLKVWAVNVANNASLQSTEQSICKHWESRQSKLSYQDTYVFMTEMMKREVQSVLDLFENNLVNPGNVTWWAGPSELIHRHYFNSWCQKSSGGTPIRWRSEL